jgi:hypothetical protein
MDAKITFLFTHECMKHVQWLGTRDSGTDMVMLCCNDPLSLTKTVDSDSGSASHFLCISAQSVQQVFVE